VRLTEEDKRGVSYFRTLDDTDHMMSLLQSVKALPEKEQAGITLGGSFIALDYINIFYKFDIPQTVIMRGHGFWTKIISKETSDMLIEFCKSKGLNFYTNQSTTEMLGDTEFNGLKLSDGTEIPAKMLGVGIGIVPDWSMLKDAGLAIDQGVLCNEFLETNIENVYTAGDVAQFQDIVVGRQYLVGNWLNALMQGRVAAGNMLGEHKAFELVSSYTTELLGLEMAFIGDTSREAADEVRQVKLGKEEAIELFDRNGSTVGAVLIGDVKPRQAITNAIKSKELYTA
jgi:NAD(P)H-nitrite reductase large subunit